MVNNMTDLSKSDLVKDEWPYSPTFQKFATFLGLTATKDAKGVNWRYDRKTADKIEEIFVWGKKKSKSDDPIDVMLMVKKLKGELGVTFEGKKLVDHLWGFVRLDTKTIEATEEMKRIEKEKTLYSKKLATESEDTEEKENQEGGDENGLQEAN